MVLPSDPRSHMAAFLYIYNLHHLTVLSEKKNLFFNMSQQRIQFVLLLTAAHRAKAGDIPEKISIASGD